MRARFNSDLSILGVALTMYDRRNRLSEQVAQDVRACLGNVVFETVIPRNVRLSEAPSHGLPALIYDHRCSGSEAYIALARELIGRLPAAGARGMSEPSRKRPSGLGRGLSALLGETAREQPVAATRRRALAGVQMLPVAAIRPASGPAAPPFRRGCARRSRRIDRGARADPADRRARRRRDGWQIVAGERRWRAAQRARLHEVPVIVRDFDDAETLEVALVENIQREDLNAIEEAEAYKRLAEDYGHTQEALGRLVNKSRSHIANLLRLLELPEPVRDVGGDGCAVDGACARADHGERSRRRWRGR